MIRRLVADPAVSRITEGIACHHGLTISQFAAGQSPEKDRDSSKTG
jgi:hypothetical protein